MNEMEAIKAIHPEGLLIEGKAVRMVEYSQGLVVAEEALKKQIQQEVVNQGGIPLSGYCPRCNAQITKPSSPVGCKWCLQRVKWRDENEDEV